MINSNPNENSFSYDESYGLRHLPRHLYRASRWQGLIDILTNFRFLEAKCRAFSVYEIENDFQFALNHWQGDDESLLVLRAFEEQLRLESHVISKAPELLFAQLYNRLTWTDWPDGKIHNLCEAAAKHHHDWLRSTQDLRLKPRSFSNSQEDGADSLDSLAITPNGSMIISGSGHGTLELRNVSSGQLVRRYDGHQGAVLALVVTPDGSQLVSGATDRTICVWDLKSGDLLRTLDEHMGIVYCLAITPDGRHIVSGSQDGTVKVWDLLDGQLLASLQESLDDGATVRAIAITPDGGQVVAAYSGAGIKVWDLASGRLLRSLESKPGEPQAWVDALAVTPDGKRVVSGSSDALIKVLDLESGKFIRMLNGQTSQVRNLAITPDGEYIVSVLGNKSTKVWHLGTGKLVMSIEERAEARGLVITPDGRLLMTGLVDASITVRKLMSGRLVRILERRIRKTHPTTGSPRSTKHRSGFENGMGMGKGLLPRRPLEGHTGMVIALAVTPDGTQLISGATDGTAKVWEIKSGRLLRSIAIGNDPASTLAISSDGRLILSGSRDAAITIWDTESGRLLKSFEPQPGPVDILAITPDKRHVISGNYSAIRIWERASGRLLSCLEEPPWRPGIDSFASYPKDAPTGMTALAITPDGKSIVSGEILGNVVIRNMPSAQPLHTFHGHGEFIKAIVVTADSKQIIAGLSDGWIKLLDLSSREVVQHWLAHRNRVEALAVVLGGEQVISGSQDKTIRLWNLRTFQSIALFQIEFGISSLIARERWIACGDESGHVWTFEWVH